MKQTNFWKNPKNSHGGAHALGKRKVARPIVTKSPMHLVFKSSRARGEWSFIRFRTPIENEIYQLAKRFRIRVRLYQNVGNHLHLVVQAATRRELQNFLRVVPQTVMFLVTGARKGHPKGRFWDALVFSRIIHWGKDWNGIRRYIIKNQLEAEGTPRTLVDKWFADAKKLWAS